MTFLKVFKVLSDDELLTRNFFNFIKMTNFLIKSVDGKKS